MQSTFNYDMLVEKDVSALSNKLKGYNIDYLVSDPPWQNKTIKMWANQADKEVNGNMHDLYNNLIYIATEHITKDCIVSALDVQLLEKYITKYNGKIINTYKFDYKKTVNYCMSANIVHFTFNQTTDIGNLDFSNYVKFGNHIKVILESLKSNSTVFDPFIGCGLTTRLALPMNFTVLGNDFNVNRLSKNRRYYD